MSVYELEAAARELSTDDRLLLIEALSDTLVAADPSIAEEWKAEIRRRIADYDAGRVKARSIDAVLAELDAGD